MTSFQGLGMCLDNSFNLFSFIEMYGISVSGYILDEPGLGLLNIVTPSSLTERVSGTTPMKAFLILLDSSETTVFNNTDGPPINIKASFSSLFNIEDNDSTSSLLIP